MNPYWEPLLLLKTAKGTEPISSLNAEFELDQLDLRSSTFFTSFLNSQFLIQFHAMKLNYKFVSAAVLLNYENKARARQ